MSTSESRRSLAGGTVVSLFTQVAAIAATAVTSVVLGRLLGPSDLGTYVLVTTLIWMTGVVAGLGFPAGITYYVSRGLSSPQKAVGASVAAGIGLGTTGAVLTLALFQLLRHNALEGVTWTMAIAAALVLPPALAARFSLSVSLAQEQYERWGALQVFQAAVGMTGAIAFAIPFGVAGAVVGFVVGQSLSSVVAVVLAARAAPPTEATRIGGMRGLFSFGAKTWSADMLQLLNYRLDIFLVNAFVDSQAVGVYAVAVAVTSLGWMVPHALASVVFPRTARLASVGREPEVANDAAVIALRHATALVPLTALALSVLVAIGVPVLYGSEFHDTIALAFILLPGALALGVGKVVSAIVAGRGHPEYSLYNTLITVPITIGLYIGLIPTLGAVGAAIASTISYLLTTAIAFAFLRRVANVRLGQIVGSLGTVVADYRAALAMLRAYPGVRRQ